MVTKKLITIISVLITIICLLTAMQVNVYADNNPISIETKNINIQSFSMSDYITTLNSNYSNGARNLISRYSTQQVHIKYTITQLYFEIDFNKHNINSVSDYMNIYSQMKTYFENESEIHIPTGTNTIDINNLHINGIREFNYTYKPSYIETYYRLRDYTIEFDTPLASNVLTSANNNLPMAFLTNGLTDSIWYDTSNSSRYITLKSLVLLGNGSINYKVEYTLPYTLGNVKYVNCQNEMSFSDALGVSDIQFNAVYNIRTNAVNYTSTQNNNFFNCSYFYTMLDNSNVSSVAYQVTKTNSYDIKAVSTSEQFLISLDITTMLPIFSIVSSDYIASDNTSNNTPLKINYYDAEWYEIHKQLANGVIFVLTELPIISNIVNAVYDMFTTITAAFNTLLEFDSFGLIFTFGMFCIVFGVLVSLM